MSRRDSREAAVKIIFQNGFLDRRLMTEGSEAAGNVDIDMMLSMYIDSISEEEAERIDRDYVTTVLNGVVDNVEQLDETIRTNAKDWTIDRMAKVDLAIMRVAIYEMQHMDDIPVSVSINEAVELAKTFSYPEAASFVNGVLGSVSR